MKAGDRVKVATNDEMNTRGLHGRYGHIVELIALEIEVNPICKHCGQRFGIHITRDVNGRQSVSGVVFCFRTGNQMFEPIETEQVALVEFNDFQSHVETKYLTVQKD